MFTRAWIYHLPCGDTEVVIEDINGGVVVALDTDPRVTQVIALVRSLAVSSRRKGNCEYLEF